MSLNERFRNAAENVKKLKGKPSEDELLEIYALFKQAEFGDCNTPSPGVLDFAGKAKWDAWNGKKGLPRESAMEMYINNSGDLIKKYGLK